MQGSWISKETENIPKAKAFRWFKEKYNLKQSFQIWNSIKVPFLFNQKIAFVFYIERGYLDFSIYDYPNTKWYRSSFSSIKEFETFDFKTYFENKNKNSIDEIGSIELNKYLNFYIHFIDEFLSEIIRGDFYKLKDTMETMDKSQLDNMNIMIENVKI